MVKLQSINVHNFEECIGLQLSQEQRKFVASNAYSLSEAYATGRDPLCVPMPYAIYHEDTMVGFVMAFYQPMDPGDPNDEEDIYYLARLMIDSKYQGTGYGRKALERYLELMRSFPHGKASAVLLSLDRNNLVANNLYSSLGFTPSDEIDDDGDVIWRLAF